MGNSNYIPAQHPQIERNMRLRNMVLKNSQQMSIVTGNGVNMIGDANKKEI